MNQTELIQFATKLGAEVQVRQFGSRHDTVCVYIGPIPDPFVGVRAWEYLLMMNECERGWTINYAQYPRTRPLEEQELKQLLTDFFRKPDIRLFRDYESD